MKAPSLPTLLLAALLFAGAQLAPPLEASHGGLGRFSHCECKGDYKPPRGVVKWYTVRVRTEWEHRVHCLPCGRRCAYEVKVVTYRDRYSDGTQRTWKCVVSRTETPLEPCWEAPPHWRK